MSYITGEVILSSQKYIPSGFLVCDGREVSRITYSDLFSVIGTTYGIGDGVNTFNVPDLRSYFIRFQDLLSGIDLGAATRTARPDGVGGDAVGTTQSAAIQAHTHPWVSYNGAQGSSSVMWVTWNFLSMWLSPDAQRIQYHYYDNVTNMVTKNQTVLGLIKY